MTQPCFDSAIACDVLVLGAGASGLMAACRATLPHKGSPAPRVLVADANTIAGRKFRLAGGGMGNITNRKLGADDYIGTSPDFVRSSLRKFPLMAALGLMQDFNLQWEEREFGQIFGTQPVSRLVDALTERAFEQGARFLFGHRILDAQKTDDGLFRVSLSPADKPHPLHVAARCLVLALGSPAWPASGATALGTTLAKTFGHSSVPFRPVLTPLVLAADHPLRGLQGISTPVAFPAGARRLVRPLLFTHRGISGPAGLIASCFWHPGTAFPVDFLPETPLKPLLDTPENRRCTAKSLLRRFLPQRLADVLAEETRRAIETANLRTPDAQLAQWSKLQRAALLHTVHEYPILPTGTEGLARAEAAAGGVITDDIDPRTMESRLTAGLHIVGELLDIAGLLGGFNLHWALASGFSAGEAIRRTLSGN